MARGGRLALTVSIVLHLAVVAALWRSPAVIVGDTPAVVEVVLEPSPSPRRARPGAAEVGSASVVRAAAPPSPEPSRAVAPAGFSAAMSPPPVAPPVSGNDAEAAARPAAAPPVTTVADPFDTWSRQVWAAVDRRRPRAEAGATAARIAFNLDREGRLKGLRLAASSGSPSFDRDAMRAVRAAAPFSPPPPGIDQQRLRFEILIRSSGG